MNLGFRVLSKPAEYSRKRVRNAVVAGTTVLQFTDGRIISFTVYPLPDGGGMATHEDITAGEEINTRLKAQYELGREQEERLRIRNLQFDTAINNMSQGLCFFDAAHRLIVCNDRYVEMYDLPRDRIGPGTPLAEIVDLRFEVGSFPAMSREEYLKWRNKVAISHEPTDSIVELRNGKTFKIRHRPMPDGGWVATHEDITEQRRSEVKIEYMAHHDALTDLANRVLLNERLEQALGQRGPPRGQPQPLGAAPARCRLPGKGARPGTVPFFGGGQGPAKENPAASWNGTSARRCPPASSSSITSRWSISRAATSAGSR